MRQRKSETERQTEIKIMRQRDRKKENETERQTEMKIMSQTKNYKSEIGHFWNFFMY